MIMQNLLKENWLVSILVLIVFLLPQISSAAELNFKVVSNDITNDKTVLVEVRIDPQSKKLNVVEGTIKFEGIDSKNLMVEVLNDESVLTIWPTVPVYLKEEKAIRFTGGVPGGFNKEGLLFSMLLKPSSNEDIIISWTDGSAYLNDGNGTKEVVTAKNMVINKDTAIFTKDLSTGKLSQFNVILLLILIIVSIVVFLYVQKKK